MEAQFSAAKLENKMNNAQEILAQDATEAQKERWAEGSAIYHEHDTRKGNAGHAEYHFADGSKIVRKALAGLTAI
jgi:hypothetical protein